MDSNTCCSLNQTNLTATNLPNVNSKLVHIAAVHNQCNLCQSFALYKSCFPPAMIWKQDDFNGSSLLMVAAGGYCWFTNACLLVRNGHVDWFLLIGGRCCLFQQFFAASGRWLSCWLYHCWLYPIVDCSWPSFYGGILSPIINHYFTNGYITCITTIEY